MAPKTGKPTKAKEEDTSPPIADQNAPYVQEIQAVVTTLTTNVKVFKGIENTKPLAVSEGGIQAPFHPSRSQPR